MKHWLPISCCLVLANTLPAGALSAAAAATAGDHGVLETAVGMEGVYYLRLPPFPHGPEKESGPIGRPGPEGAPHKLDLVPVPHPFPHGPAVEALPVDEKSPVVLRIAGQAESAGSTIYEIRYLGMLPGRYDLRRYLRRVDGRPLKDVGPMMVSVVSVLSANHNGQLDELAHPRLQRAWPYRAALILAAGLWLVPLAWLVARAAVRRKPRPAPPPPAEPTLADQLQPLVEAAIAGSLAPAGQARLELLLIAFWRQRLGLADGTVDAALARLRGHAEAGILLGQLDQWLHQRPAGNGQADVAAILRPYRDAAPIEPPEAPSDKAPSHKAPSKEAPP